MTTIMPDADVRENIDVDELVDTDEWVETDDPSVRTHVINPQGNLHIYIPGMTTKELVRQARIMGLEIRALCGYIFVPKHNPDQFDACESCIKIAGEIMRGAGE